MSGAVDPWIGRTIEGRYRIKRRIGRGGMGVVYEAEHAALDRRVAIKLIAATEAPDAYLTRFRREAKLASRITHEHLVHIYDVGTDGATSTDYMVMEYVEGRDLGQELEIGPLSIARTIRIARQLLEGLHAIHEGGIIHRDIKPANVMLTTRSGDRDFVKLMDFGIARALGDASLTATGHVVGTPNFMAPEQLRGHEVDRRTDLYAVGVTLFAMIAGKLPFEGNTAMLAGAHVFQPPPSLARLRPETPPALVAAVERALAKAPADRFADALELARALESRTRSPSRAPTPATPSVVTVADRPRAKRRSRMPIVIGAVAAAAVIAGVTWYLQRPGTPAASATTTTTTTTTTALIVPTPVPKILPDAAVPIAVDASSDAALVAVVPAKPVDKRPGPSASGPTKLCHCIPTSAPDVSPLCPTKGPSLCRCDMPGGKSLCPSKLVVHRICDLGNSFDCAPNGVICPDKQYTKYHLPGRADEACSGYVVPTWGDPDQSRQNGHLECDVCPGTALDRFKGRDGELCNGFYWRTGEPKTGTLAHCQ